VSAVDGTHQGAEWVVERRARRTVERIATEIADRLAY
jgi:hypothetical protein